MTARPTIIFLGDGMADEPVAVRMAGVPADDVATYDEFSCLTGALNHMAKDDLMNLLLGDPR